MNEKPAQPDYLKELQGLRDSGGIDKVSGWIREKKEVWVRRSSGAWQKATVYELGHAGLSSGVSWPKPGGGPTEVLAKHVDTVDLLRWQDEAAAEGL